MYNDAAFPFFGITSIAELEALTPDTLVALLDSMCDKLWIVEFTCNSKGYVRITTIMEPDRD